MFGISLFAVPLFAESGVLAEYVPSEEFTFNTYGLQNPGQYGIHIQDYEIAIPTRDFKTAPVPGGHGLILKEDWFRANPITLTGWVEEPTKIQLDNKIHEFMRNVHGLGGKLIIDNGGTYKELITTLQTAVFESEHFSTIRKEFSITFSGLTSFWRDNTFTSESLFNNTTLSVDGNMNNSGSAVADPVVIIIFSAASGVSGVSFENTLTGEKVEISETISAGQVVIFDAEAKIVTVDGTEVEFDGRFPSLPVGLNSYTIAMTGTSCTTDITAKHKNTYLTP